MIQSSEGVIWYRRGRSPLGLDKLGDARILPTEISTEVDTVLRERLEQPNERKRQIDHFHEQYGKAQAAIERLAKEVKELEAVAALPGPESDALYELLLHSPCPSVRKASFRVFFFFRSQPFPLSVDCRATVKRAAGVVIPRLKVEMEVEQKRAAMCKTQSEEAVLAYHQSLAGNMTVTLQPPAAAAPSFQVLFLQMPDCRYKSSLSLAGSDVGWTQSVESEVVFMHAERLLYGGAPLGVSQSQAEGLYQAAGALGHQTAMGKRLSLLGVAALRFCSLCSFVFSSVAFCALHGLGMAEDQKKGIELVRTAAEQKYAPAYNLLGLCVYPVCSFMASDSDCRCLIDRWVTGVCYMSGRGVAQDEKQAVDWFTLAAQKKYPPALAQLGTAHTRALRRTIARLDSHTHTTHRCCAVRCRTSVPVRSGR